MDPRLVEKPLSCYFDRKRIAEMIKLLRKGYVFPRHKYGAFSSRDDCWCYTFVKDDDVFVFRFKRSFPFIIGAVGEPGDPVFRELLLEKLQKLLEEI